MNLNTSHERRFQVDGMRDNPGQMKISRRSFLIGATGVSGGLLLGGALYREPRALQVEEISLVSPKVPRGVEVRLVQLSDLHIDALGPYHQDVAATVNALEPDAILLTGDYLEKSRNIWDVRDFLKMLRPRQGLFAVQGNWDYWARLEGENLRRHFAQSDATLLINERRDVDVRGASLSILGLDYPSTADALLRLQDGADPERLNVLLSHVPAFSHQYLDAGVDLILSGHTHGGQVRLPFVPPFYLPRFSGRFIEGLFKIGPHETPLYVNRGIGTSFLPLRLFCRPEVTVVRFIAQKSQSGF
jgi:uncharacterized protein